jgi:hypothetical protein
VYRSSEVLVKKEVGNGKLLNGPQVPTTRGQPLLST